MPVTKKAVVSFTTRDGEKIKFPAKKKPTKGCQGCTDAFGKHSKTPNYEMWANCVRKCKGMKPTRLNWAKKKVN